MYFPQEIWCVIKGYLLYKSEIVWKRIEEFHQKHTIGLDLQLHLYYRVLQTTRDDILDSILEFMSNAHSMLETIYSNVRYTDNYYSYFPPNIEFDWRLFSKNEEMACLFIKVYKLCDTFLNIYESSSIQVLLEILDTINQLVLGNGVTYLIIRNYLFLHRSRQKTPEGVIRYIWEIDDKSDFAEIQTVVNSPGENFPCKLRIIDKFVVGMDNSGYINPNSFGKLLASKRIGRFATDTMNSCHKTIFKRFLDEAGFPIKNDYKIHKMET